jgi:hypothetical protein
MLRKGRECARPEKPAPMIHFIPSNRPNPGWPILCAFCKGWGALFNGCTPPGATHFTAFAFLVCHSRREPASAVVVARSPHNATTLVISTEGGAFAAAAERPAVGDSRTNPRPPNHSRRRLRIHRPPRPPAQQGIARPPGQQRLAIPPQPFVVPQPFVIPQRSEGICFCSFHYHGLYHASDAIKRLHDMGPRSSCSTCGAIIARYGVHYASRCATSAPPGQPGLARNGGYF